MLVVRRLRYATRLNFRFEAGVAILFGLSAYDANDLANVLTNVHDVVATWVAAKAPCDLTAGRRLVTGPERAGSVTPKMGQVDTPMGLPFIIRHSPYGAAPGLLEKPAGAALNSKAGEVIKAGLIGRHSLSDALSNATKRCAAR